MTLWMELLIILQLMVGLPVDILVDASHELPRWYDPGVNTEMVAALDEMIHAAEADGVRLGTFSDYRSYEHQSETFLREEAEKGEAAGLALAHPGSSEHQLGTALDVVWPGLHIETRDPRNFHVYEWIEENAHTYGFVVSYPLKTIDGWPYDNKLYPNGTEFIYEPWHIRFVGKDLARAIFEAGYLNPESDVVPQDFYRVWP